MLALIPGASPGVFSLASITIPVEISIGYRDERAAGPGLAPGSVTELLIHQLGGGEILS